MRWSGSIRLARDTALAALALSGCAVIAGVEDGELAKDGGIGGGTSGGGTSGIAGTSSGGSSNAGGSSGGGAGGASGGGASGSGGGGAGGSSAAGGTSGAGGGASGEGGASGASGSTGGGGASGGGASGASGSGGSSGSTGSRYADAVMADGPVAYLRLGEKTGTTAIDITGNGHDGLLRGGVTLAAPGALVGDSDTAMYFDGTSYVDVGDELDFAGTAPLSLEAWVYPQAGRGGYLGKSMYDLEYKGYFIADNDSTIQWVREGAGASPPVISFTQYSHLVGTYDGLNLILYINGAKASTRTATNPVTDHPNPFTIGQVADWGDFVGWIDEVAVYDKALDATRVKAHYDAGRGL